MACTSSKTMARWLTALILAGSLSLLIPAKTVQADMLVELQTGPTSGQSAGLLQTHTPDSTIGLNNRGDLVIRYKAASLTIAYTLNEASAPFHTAPHNPLQHLEPPSMAGVSLALAIAF